MMLLPFGSIAPGLLLPLLAFAYMLFCGSWALNKTSADDNAADPEVRIILESVKSSASDATTCYFFSGDDSTDPGLHKDEDSLPPDRHIFLVIKIPDEDITTDYLLLFSFIRPPPSATKA